MSDSLRPDGLQHIRLPWPISCSLIKLMCIESVMPSNHLILRCPFLLLPSVFPKIMSFPMRQLFVSGGQSIGASAMASVLPINIQGWFPFGLTGFILAVQGPLKSLLQHHNWKSINSLSLSFLCSLNLTSVSDYRKHYSFESMGLCLQSGVSAV